MLIGVVLALTVANPGLKAISWESVKGEFEHAS